MNASEAEQIQADLCNEIKELRKRISFLEGELSLLSQSVCEESQSSHSLSAQPQTVVCSKCLDKVSDCDITELDSAASKITILKQLSESYSEVHALRRAAHVQQILIRQLINTSNRLLERLTSEKGTRDSSSRPTQAMMLFPSTTLLNTPASGEPAGSIITPTTDELEINSKTMYEDDTAAVPGVKEGDVTGEDVCGSGSGGGSPCQSNSVEASHVATTAAHPSSPPSLPVPVCECPVCGMHFPPEPDPTDHHSTLLRHITSHFPDDGGVDTSYEFIT